MRSAQKPVALYLAFAIDYSAYGGLLNFEHDAKRGLASTRVLLDQEEQAPHVAFLDRRLNGLALPELLRQT